MKDYNFFFSFAEEDESAAAEEGGDISEEARQEEDEVSCCCGCIPATSNVDMLFSYSTKFPIILTSLIIDVYVEVHNSITHQCML
jgi:hypothetical protein